MTLNFSFFYVKYLIIIFFIFGSLNSYSDSDSEKKCTPLIRASYKTKYIDSHGSTRVQLNVTNGTIDYFFDTTLIRSIRIPFSETVIKLSLSPSEEYLVVFTDKAQRVYRLNDSQLVYDFQKIPNLYAESVSTYVSWSPDGTKLLTFDFEHGLFKVYFLDLFNMNRGHFIVLKPNGISDYFYSNPAEVIWSKSGAAFAILREHRIKKRQWLAQIYSADGALLDEIKNNRSDIHSMINTYNHRIIPIHP
ncbi:MAG TPA: hypothetical protein PLJ21_10625 [Pseudobdellovibrionaceae bacterium]|nr:hypothetical protein [Pseudobdellovibrionaceae bacterium]